MPPVIIIKIGHHVNGLLFLAFSHRILIHIFKHEGAKVHGSPLHFRRHPDLRLVHAVDDHIMDHRIQANSGRISKNLPIWFRNIFLFEHASPDRVVNIMVDIGNLIRQAYDLSFQRMRRTRGFMIQDSVTHFPGQVQSLALLFQTFHHPYALLVMLEPQRAYLVKRPFSRMAERRMPQIMPQRDRLHQIFIETKSLCYCPGILGYLQRMGQPGPVMIPFGKKEYLRLLLQPAKCLAVEDPVPVPLEDGTDIAFLFRAVSSS